MVNNGPISKQGFVSVLMTAYKEPVSVFLEALDSILEQTFTNYEIVLIVDNPSYDELIEVAHDRASEHNNLRVFVNENNMGLAQSLNKAIELARGVYFCRMDADDVAFPNRIENQLNCLLGNNLDLVGSYLEVVNPDNKLMYNVENIPTKPDKIKKALRWNNCIPHPTWLGKREIFEQKYRNINLCEDYDLLLRSVLAGYRLGNCNQVLLKYRMSEKSISRRNLYEQYLSQCYLTACYQKGLVADIKKMQVWIESRKSTVKAKKYALANAKFNDGTKFLANKSYLKALTSYFSIVGLSPSYLNKIRRLLFASFLGDRPK